MNSNKFEELKKKCFKIFIKKIIKFCIYLFLLLFFLGIIFLYIQNKQIKKIHTNIKKTNKKILKKNEAYKVVNHKKNISDKNKVVVVLKPDINMTIDASLIKKQTSQIQKISAKPVAIKKIIKKSLIEKKPILNMSIKNTNEETILLKNYQILKQYKTAIKLAEYYFEQKQYEKAVYWSKKASKINTTAFKPWIIYAKSKYIMGKKEEAIHSLETFLNFSYSRDVANLLHSYLKKRR